MRGSFQELLLRCIEGSGSILFGLIKPPSCLLGGASYWLSSVRNGVTKMSYGKQRQECAKRGLPLLTPGVPQKGYWRSDDPANDYCQDGEGVVGGIFLVPPPPPPKARIEYKGLVGSFGGE